MGKYIKLIFFNTNTAGKAKIKLGPENKRTPQWGKKGDKKKTKTVLSLKRRRRNKVEVTWKITAIFLVHENCMIMLLGENIYSACWLTYTHSIL